MRPGPRPKPNILQIKLGDPGKRAKARQSKAPKPAADALKCPTQLGKFAKAEWRRVLSEFGKMEADGQRLLTNFDRAALAAYCQAWEDFTVANIQIKKNDYTYTITDRAGNLLSIRKSPYVEIKRDAIMQILRLSAEFGFTPAARARIEAEDITAGDPMAEFLKKKPGKKQA